MTVYIEYVLIDNFVIDYLLTSATFYIVTGSKNKGRVFLSAIIGSLISLVFPLINTHTLIITVLKICTGVMLVAICYDFKSKKTFFVLCTVFIFLTFALGGAIMGIYAIFGLDYTTEISIATIILPAYLLIKCITEIVKFIYRKRTVFSCVYDVKLTLNGKSIEARGFLDTGNALYDGNSPVIMCNASVAKKFIGESLPKMKRISVNTVNGVKEQIAFSLDEIIISFGDAEVIFKGVTACVSSGGFEGGYDVILHPALLESKNFFEKRSIDKKNLNA